MSWPTVQLSDVAKIDRNGIKPNAIEVGMRYVGLEHIATGGSSISSIPVVIGELSSAKFRFGARHVLFGKLRPYLAKIVCPDFEGICSTDILPILPSEKIDRRYLAHFLRQQKVVDWATTRATGINLPRLSPKELVSLEIPLPPLDEQRRIAAILDKADGLRRKRQRALDLLDGLTQSIFLEMFGDPLSAAEDAPVQPLENIAELINGDRSSNYPKQEDIVGDGIPFLSTASLTEFGVNFKKTNFITPEKFATLSRGKLARGDIVVTLRGTLGLSAIFEGPFETGFINAQMIIVRCRSNADRRYLASFLGLQSTRQHLKRLGSGSAVPQLTAAQMKKLPVLLPPLEQQRSFSDRAEVVMKLRLGLLHVLGSMDRLFTSLQSRAFS